MYSVHQHWDRLKTCIVGRSYPPEFYSYINNKKVRSVMERIANETEEDFQKLVKLLESFNVEVLRPEIQDSIEYYIDNNRFIPPPMTPRDTCAMIGNTFYWDDYFTKPDPTSPFPIKSYKIKGYENILKKIKNVGNEIVYNKNINTAMVTRVGKDLYFGTPVNQDLVMDMLSKSEKFLNRDISLEFVTELLKKEKQNVSDRILANLMKKHNNEKYKLFAGYRCHTVNSEGHTDGVFCPVVPGLIVSLFEIQKYEKTFPNWEIIYLNHQSWEAIVPFLNLKMKNQGKWWVPGEELNDDFTDYVEKWLSHWVGYVEESVFDVNMLVIDKKNVVCNNYNKTVFDAFERYGITPHIINFRHRYFWDGGLHCITTDLDREGVMQDYFPERN